MVQFPAANPVRSMQLASGLQRSSIILRSCLKAHMLCWHDLKVAACSRVCAWQQLKPAVRHLCNGWSATEVPRVQFDFTTFQSHVVRS